VSAATVPRAVGDPILVAAARERQRDEGRAGVVEPDAPPGGGRLVELGAVDARRDEVRAEALGPSGPDWPNLRDLMRESADRVVRDLVSKNESVLLTQPGLLARYRLDSFLTTLLEATQKDDGPAVFLLVPAYDELGPAPIDAVPDPMPIPQSSPAQRLRVPESWIENRHRADG
jgi:hypothetical protein